MPAEILTFGCRLNIHESEAMRRLIDPAPVRSDGVAGAEGKPLLVVNSCAVTAEAGRQVRQGLRRLARERPDARLVVTGCGAEVERDLYLAMPEVDHVVGNAEKLKAATWRSVGPGAPRLIASDVMAAQDIALPAIDRFAGRVRGFVQVQNGCDHRCTFCAIPFGRGNSRSLAGEEVVRQVRSLVEAGIAEVVLTGVDLTSYAGRTASGAGLGALVRQILAEVPELPRLRLSSIDSIEADAALLDCLAEEERLMPHLHLSLQSGDDLILKRMKRRHSAAQAVRFCAEARRRRPDIAFGADIIAGFPTETDAMFARSLELIEACGIAHLHAFPFSPRPGTPAARMPPVSPPVVRERARRLLEAGARALAAALEGEIGRQRRGLVEHGGLARTGQFHPVRLAAPPPPGTLLPLTILGHDGRILVGEPVETASHGPASRSFGTFDPQRIECGGGARLAEEPA